MNQFISANEIAKLLSIPPKSVYLYAKQGLIPFVRVGKHLRFEQNEVVAQLKAMSSDCLATPKRVSNSKPDFDELAKLVDIRSLKTEKSSLAPTKGAVKDGS